MEKRIEVITDISLLSNEWDTLVNQCDTDNVFLTFDWILCWLKVYQANGQLHIITIKEGNSLIAIAPLMIVKFSEYGLMYRRLQFIGSRSCDYMDFIVLKDREECFRMIFDTIKENKKQWDFCELLHISDAYSNFHLYFEYTKENFSVSSLTKESVCPYLKLNFTLDDYYKSRTAGLRYDLKRGESEFVKLGKFEYTIIKDQKQALDEFPVFFSMLYEREQFKGRHRDSLFIIKQKEIFKEYVTNDNFWSKINFCKLSLNDVAVAYHFGFDYKKKFYWYKPTFDIKYVKFSAGKLVIKKTIEYALDNGYIELDFLLGNEPYKYQWTKEERASYTFCLSNNRLKSKLLYKWFLTVKPLLKQNKLFTRVKRSVSNNIMKS